MATTENALNVEGLPPTEQVPQAEGAQPDASRRPWTPWQLISFRVAFIFLGQLLVPSHWSWYQRLPRIHSLDGIFSLSMGLGINYVRLNSESGRWGIGSFASWGIALAVAIVGAAIWTWFARHSQRKEYDALYYWLRLAVRYWAALNIFYYGYDKVWPAQMPFPSISHLHTLLGETANFRLYWQYVGMVTWYEVVLGVLEVTAGSLLLFNATTAIGAVLNFGILYNITHANFAYDGGVQIESGKICLFSGFLLLLYVPDVWRLLVRKEDVQPHYYRPIFSRRWQRRTFLAVKILAWALFIPGYAYASHYAYYRTNLSKEPRAPGLPGAKGYYNVTEFRIDNKDMPYSPLDPIRWQSVVFEDYPTLVYKVDRAFPILRENGSRFYTDSQKIYELCGIAGGKVYLAFKIDAANHILYLQDKNPLNWPHRNGSGRRGRGEAKSGSASGPVRLIWHYSQPSNSRIILSGLDDNGNSIYVVLDRIDEKLPIQIESPVQGEPLHYGIVYKKRYPVTGASFDGTGAPSDLHAREITP